MTRLTSLPGFIILRPTVQHYDWGGVDFIPSLLGIGNKKRQPFAELWMGAHPKNPSVATIDGQEIPLDKLFEIHATGLMGEKAAAKFDNRLPFLFKILDVQKMLSIQVHPAKAQAEAGFQRENKLNIPLMAPHRNYKDDNHKPEVHVALTDFWMLHGFRPLAEIAAMLAKTAEFRSVMPEFAARLQRVGKNNAQQQLLLKDLYTKMMTMPQAEVDAILSPLIKRITPLYEAGALEKDAPDFWAARAASQFAPRKGKYDRGIFCFYLLNLVHLQAGEGTFQDAGTLHAYLEGQNVELMANSDNVLRGGLTPKHIDIPELLQTVKFTCARPEILCGTSISDNEQVFEASVQDFQLSRIQLHSHTIYESRKSHGLEIFLVLNGSLSVATAEKTISLSKGCVFLLRANTKYFLRTNDKAMLFRAAVPGRFKK